MGSCRLSATREGGPLRESGETWECNGLFVADASVFPTSLGINPMITVEAVAYMVAEQVRFSVAGCTFDSGKQKVGSVCERTAVSGFQPMNLKWRVRRLDACEVLMRVSRGDLSGELICVKFHAKLSLERRSTLPLALFNVSKLRRNSRGYELGSLFPPPL